MEEFKIEADLKIFGFKVVTFPNGISDAFDQLARMLKGDDRPFYGVSQCINGKVDYLAAALQMHDGEAEKYGCETHTIESGVYMFKELQEWRGNTGQIKDIIKQLIKNERADRNKPVVEIYTSGHEMVCMVKIKEG